MTPKAAKFFKSFLTVIVAIIALGITSASAQETTLKSRVAVVANDTKTNIWISDFPKNTSVIIYDTEDNLLSILSTNNYGAAYLSLPKGIKTGVIVKTIDGEITASNKAAIRIKSEEQSVVSTYQEESIKA